MAKLNANSKWLWPLVVLTIAFGAFYFKPWQTKPAQTISVTAEGKAQAAPNVAKITATVETQNKNLDEARAQNEQKVSTIVAKLKDLGIEEKDIKTENISSGPSFEIQIYPRPPRPTTNQFSTNLSITIRNFEIADETIAALTQNGAENIYGPNLTLDEEAQNTAKSQAREKAVEAARNKAQELARLTDRKLGKVTSINEEGEVRLPEPIFAQNEVELRQKASAIQPGQNEITVTVQVEFELD